VEEGAKTTLRRIFAGDGEDEDEEDEEDADYDVEEDQEEKDESDGGDDDADRHSIPGDGQSSNAVLQSASNRSSQHDQELAPPAANDELDRAAAPTRAAVSRAVMLGLDD